MKFSWIFLINSLVIIIFVTSSTDGRSSSSQSESLELEWNRFKQTYRKQYESIEEHERRREIFRENFRKISEHNQLYHDGLRTYQLAVNKFADWTLMEFVKFTSFGTPIIVTGAATTSNNDAAPVNIDASLPDEVDWTGKGLVTAVEDQGQCGSCWAYSAVGAIEGQLAKKTGKLQKLSVQQLVDCSRSEGNNGCDGGYPKFAYNYIRQNGIDTAESYPYTGKDQTCQQEQGGKTIATKLSSVRFLPAEDEQALKQAVAEVGPISSLIDGGQFQFMFYKSGLYDNSWCSTIVLNHAITVVGYGTMDDGRDYWKVKNSYGQDWGMDGYILMSRNKQNQCGIASNATYPIL